MKPHAIIHVGAGEYLRSLVQPALDRMQSEGFASLMETIGLPHERGRVTRTRSSEQLLSNLLENTRNDPIIILGHANNAHANDTEDLVNAGFSVILEKPYALNTGEATRIRRLLERYPNRIALAEYYLTMKSAPALFAAGLLKPGTFYDNELVVKKPISRSLAETIGSPCYVLCDVLEGEGTTGTLNHRGHHLIDRALGGGMIQDLGIHAITPLLALEHIIGKISDSIGTVQTRQDPAYITMARQVHKLSEDRIAESYAEISLRTVEGIPVNIRVGKYTPKNANQRRLILVGTEGSAMLDLSSLTLQTQYRDNPFQTVASMPKGPDKYYAVLRSCIEQLNGNCPFTFDPNMAALRAQEIVLKAIEIARTPASKQM